MKSSAKSGQSQLLIPLLMIITSAIVFATNVTINLTNQTITGAMIGIPAVSQEFAFPIEIWANTSIDLRIENNLVRAALLMDNGSSVSRQRLDFFLNDTMLFSDLTDKDGLISFALPFNGTIKVVFKGSDYLNPSENKIGNGIIENETNVSKYEWISYDDQTDIIRIAGDGSHCTEDSPCSLTEIYEAMVERGISNIEKYRTFFIFNSGLQIGNGINETWLVSTSEHISIKKPWEVMPNANLRFGILEDGEYARNGVFFETNVSEEDQLENGTALKVDENASLYFYQSSYKIFSDAENNINQDKNSNFHAVRFDVQRVQSKNDVKTEVKIPDNATVEDYVEREKIDYVYNNETIYQKDGGGEQ
jgi:hypothetical protein